jgi:hypothetical protein
MLQSSKGGTQSRQYVYDIATLSWVAMEQPILEAGSVTISGTVAATQSGDWDVGERTTGTAAVTSVASSVTVVTLLAANASRRMATVHNDSSDILYLKLGSAASLTSFTVRMVSQAYYELPHPVYTGIITGIWDVATGSARVTEIT